MIRLLMVCILFLFVISGCGFKDIDKRFFVVAIGVDKSNDPDKPYRVSLKLGIPSPRIEPGTTNKFQLVSQNAKTITEAVRLLKSQVDKELDFGHAKMIVFGKSLAREDIQKPLDWFMRRRDIQMVSFLALGGPSAVDVLNTRVLSERLPANSLFLSFDKEGTESSYIMTENLSDFYRRMTERGKDAYLPVIHPLEANYEIDRVALFDKHKLKVILNPDQTRILNELVRKYKKVDVHVEQANDSFELSINSLKVNYAFSQPKGDTAPEINMVIAMQGFAEESTHPLFNDNWKDLQSTAGQQVEERVRKVLNILQKNEVDPIGFGLRYRAIGHTTDKDWEKWQSLYPSIKINVKLNITILSSGVVK